VADEDQDLGERDHEEPVEYSDSERVIHTQGYDLSVSTLKDQWDDKTLVLPDFQREYVWDNPKASRLVESLLLNIPIPPLFFSETEEAKHEVVDGYQRVFSLVRYLDNQFALSGLRISDELKGLRFHQLPDRAQRHLRTRVIRAIIISADSSATMKFEVFERLNTGGVSLNAQEIRNAISSGKFNDMLRDLESDRNFRVCIGTEKPRRRMVDRELVLRFFALEENLASYKPPLVRLLNDYQRDHRNPPDEWIVRQRERFESTMKLISNVMGIAAFRVIESNGMVERSVNRALFDAETIVFANVNVAEALDRAETIVSNINHLFVDKDFLDAIRRATGDRSRTMQRVRQVIQAFESSGVSVDPSLISATNS
jgi:hypothetical protein